MGKKQKVWGNSTVCLVMLLMSACGSKTDAPGEKAPQQVVELKMTAFSTSTKEDDFNLYMKPFIEKKFPNIKATWITPPQGQTFDQMIAAGDVPDIVVTGYTHIADLLDKDIPLDLNGMVKSEKLNLSVFQPTALQSVQIYGEKGELYALPYTANFMATFYNKDIFDKFAVPYPKDNESWEELNDLGKKLTRSVDGVDYRGLVPLNTYFLFGRGLSLTLVDPKTDKSVLNTDSWLEATRLIKSIYAIPGNEKPINGTNAFMGGTVAMIPNWGQATIQRISKDTKAGKTLNWDMIAYPHFKSSPGQNFEISTNVYVLSKASQNQKAAFQVMSYLASSTDVQTLAATYGNLPSTNIKGIETIFGSAIPELKGKNVAGLFKSTYRKDHTPSQYDPIAQSAYNKYVNQVIAGNMDERTALAAADEETNKAIEEKKVK